jgi:serine/threonine-protein kinase HipA
MNRQALVYMHGNLAGTLAETEKGYAFWYNKNYLASAKAQAISFTLPLSAAAYSSTVLFPFFDGLIPEGWLLQLAEENWKLNSRDRFGLLLLCCKNCIGAVSVVKEENEKL